MSSKIEQNTHTIKTGWERFFEWLPIGTLTGVAISVAIIELFGIPQGTPMWIGLIWKLALFGAVLGGSASFIPTPWLSGGIFWGCFAAVIMFIVTAVATVLLGGGFSFLGSALAATIGFAGGVVMYITAPE